ncbi:hypothetical protein [Gracilimonas mengyeensis]|uniref:Uncharacterized protein n=1 Tax=Gracilimonas mengyeensis TaxID=1302730 RepID=A0A521EMK4_9BACT|nr:hypothetical protein [Gracilimonas mengyeensis]SMO84340.1 hypothetical protein SAMN06265219_112104 [Gracilimonas mengyeensis]
MNTSKIAVFALFLLFITAGCASTGSQYVLNPEYQNRAKAFDTSVTIFPLTEDLVEDSVWQQHLNYAPENYSLINFANKQTFIKYFALSFSETTTGEVNNVMADESVELSEEVDFSNQSLPINDKEELKLLVPEAGKLVTDEMETDFSLLIQSINWQIGQVEEQSKPIGGNNDLFIELVIKFKYVIWDNQRERVAGYGLVRESEVLSGRPGRITYIQIFEKISREIVQNSPLQERYVQEY